MMNTNKKQKTSKFGLGGLVKGEHESIEKKDVFEFLFPDGWMKNPLYRDGNQDDCDYSDEDDDGDDANEICSSVTGASSVAKKKLRQPFFVVCGECGKHTGSNKTTHYGNAVDHALRTCYHVTSLHKLIRKWRKQEVSGRGGARSRLISSSPSYTKPSPRRTLSILGCDW